MHSLEDIKRQHEHEMTMLKLQHEIQMKKLEIEHELKMLDIISLKFTFVLKPSVGFLSFGVYPVKNEDEFKNVIDICFENNSIDSYKKNLFIGNENR